MSFRLPSEFIVFAKKFNCPKKTNHTELSCFLRKSQQKTEAELNAKEFLKILQRSLISVNQQQN